MGARLPFALILVPIAAFAIFACAPCLAAGRGQPWRGLAKRIGSTSHPDSTAVIVLLDEDVVDSLRSWLPKAFKVVPFRNRDAEYQDSFLPARLGQMYRDAATSTWSYADVWIVGRGSSLPGRIRAARFAASAASLLRLRVLRDSVRTSDGTVEFSRWVDRPGGAAQRGEMIRGRAYADSVLAHGIPKPVPITRPFTRGELDINPDTLSFYVARLADTSFYSIGGCSEVEITNWTAPQRLAQLGPGVVPALVGRIDDPNPFVRERVQEALLLATQDEQILARTAGDYLKFYDKPGVPARDVVGTWWTKFGHFWTPADSTR